MAKHYRVDREQSNSFKRGLAFAIFIIVSLTMICTMFLNPAFMKKQIRTSNNEAVIARQVNHHFNTLATLISSKSNDSDYNLLTNKQTLPISDDIIDYTLGFHGLRMSDTAISQKILKEIYDNVDSGSSSAAQSIRHDLKKQGSNAVYAVISAFNLSVVSLGANIALTLLVVNIVIIIITIISAVSLINEIRHRLNGKVLVHYLAASFMWAGFWLMLVYGLLSVIPIFLNVEAMGIGDLAYLLEIASTIFLDFVIAGAALFVISAIPWQASNNN